MGADTLDPVTKKRSYAANAHLGQARSRENLTVWTGVLVNKIIFSDTSDADGNVRATGVQYTAKSLSGEPGVVRATKEGQPFPPSHGSNSSQVPLTIPLKISEYRIKLTKRSDSDPHGRDHRLAQVVRALGRR